MSKELNPGEGNPYTTSYFELIENETVKTPLRQLGALDLVDENVIIYLMQTIKDVRDFDSSCAELGKVLGYKTGTVKNCLRSVKLALVSQNWSGVEGRDSQIVQGDYHRNGLSHRQSGRG